MQFYLDGVQYVSAIYTFFFLFSTYALHYILLADFRKKGGGGETVETSS